jgi:vacuolar protein sorting-associated protein 52
MQLDMNLERLRSAVDDLVIRLAQCFTSPKLQHLFLLNNYDMAVSVLKVSFPLCKICTLYSYYRFVSKLYHSYLYQEAGDEGKKVQIFFEEKLESNMTSFVVNQSFCI